MKMKTRKAAAKRYKITGTGKVKFKKPGLRHNLGNKSANQKRAKRAGGYVSAGFIRHVEKCMPYGC